MHQHGSLKKQKINSTNHFNYKDMRIYSISKFIDFLFFIDTRVLVLPSPKPKAKKEKPPKAKPQHDDLIRNPITGEIFGLNHNTITNKNGKVIEDKGTTISKGGRVQIKNQYSPILTGYDIQEIADANLKTEYATAFKGAMANGDTIKEMLSLKIGPGKNGFKESTVKSYRRAFRIAFERETEDTTTPLSPNPIHAHA
jgi:hypothetical protein